MKKIDTVEYFWIPAVPLRLPILATPPLPRRLDFGTSGLREGEGGGSEILDFYKVLEETLTRQ